MRHSFFSTSRERNTKQGRIVHQQLIAGGVILLPAVAGGAPQTGPPGGVPGPAVPQLPFAADPCTITGWRTM
eukprot:scaffold184138_cov39-Attheya_sp.AAC.1